jgi:hypothetical protein
LTVEVFSAPLGDRSKPISSGGGGCSRGEGRSAIGLLFCWIPVLLSLGMRSSFDFELSTLSRSSDADVGGPTSFIYGRLGGTGMGFTFDSVPTLNVDF